MEKLKSQTFIEIKKGENSYQFIMPVGVNLEEAHEAILECSEIILKLSKRITGAHIDKIMSEASENNFDLFSSIQEKITSTHVK